MYKRWNLAWQREEGKEGEGERREREKAFVFECNRSGVGDCEKDGSGLIIWRMVRSVLAIAWTIEIITLIGHPPQALCQVSPPVLLPGEFRKYSFANIVPGPIQ